MKKEMIGWCDYLCYYNHAFLPTTFIFIWVNIILNKEWNAMASSDRINKRRNCGKVSSDAIS